MTRLVWLIGLFFSDQENKADSTIPSVTPSTDSSKPITEVLDNKIFTAKDFPGYTDEQILAAQVWYSLTDGQYPFSFYRKEAGTPINYHNGIGKSYPSVTYHLYEDSKRSYAYQTVIDYADNGDGTITLYSVPKHWHVPDSEAEAVTEIILNTAKIVKLKPANKAAISRILATVNFKADADTGASKQQPQGTNTSSGSSEGLINKEPVSHKEEQKVESQLKGDENKEKKSIKEGERSKNDKATLPQTGEQLQSFGLEALILAVLGLGGLVYKGRHNR
ncbi:hypothetical protein STRDD10_02024 [Streptococcus sp. DD10]|uniref:LPXTG cell wall anchor domain-containing protein n=1 Tax=Streptococcus sp. DD10 TaxID=1777878 RepID=UPI000793B594|nr:LPXTG cell wall anchor domain-containing protein [Streptococcus sp. DD10]KXT72132.1 hypothetical protein STRDD10_02024 [Streptococcus sp. DD10]